MPLNYIGKLKKCLANHVHLSSFGILKSRDNNINKMRSGRGYQEIDWKATGSGNKHSEILTYSLSQPKHESDMMLHIPGAASVDAEVGRSVLA